MVRHRINTFLASIVVWWGINFFWLRQDCLIRDGDEEGHVGAMEIFKDLWIEEGWVTWILESWMGSYGEYPPLFAGLIGLWWGMVSHIFGTIPPESLWIRSILPCSVLFTALACARITWRMNLQWLIAGIWILYSPLFNGVGRHFMPESWMTMWVCIATMFTIEGCHNNVIKHWIAAGFAVGCALLTKQTAIIFIIPILLSIWWSNRTLNFKNTWTPLIVTALIVTFPWYWSQLSQQWTYLSTSATSKTHSSGLSQLFLYPSRVFFDLPNILAVTIIFWKKARIPKWALGWMLSVLALMLVPKQYPRLLITWLPIIGILLATINIHKRWIMGLHGIAILGLCFHSFHPLHTNLQSTFSSIQKRIDDGCTQHWIRTPSTQDGHLSKISKQVTQVQSAAVLVQGDPSIPCSIQSTHNWSYHLEPYLRRRGLEPTIHYISSDSNPPIQWQDYSIQIRWKGDTIESGVEILHVP